MPPSNVTASPPPLLLTQPPCHHTRMTPLLSLPLCQLRSYGTKHHVNQSQMNRTKSTAMTPRLVPTHSHSNRHSSHSTSNRGRKTINSSSKGQREQPNQSDKYGTGWQSGLIRCRARRTEDIMGKHCYLPHLSSMASGKHIFVL